MMIALHCTYFECKNIHTAEPDLTGNVREWDILGSKYSSGRRQPGRPMGPLGRVGVDTFDTWVLDQLVDEGIVFLDPGFKYFKIL